MVNYKELGLVNTRDMFARAIKGGYAIPAFNFNNLEQLQAIIKASSELKSPVILQVSKGARAYANETLLRYMAEGAVEYAKELGCNKLALGHNYDDAVETFMMNLFNEGRIGCFAPVSYMSKRDLTVIRPMVLAPERDVLRCAEGAELTVVKSKCPEAGHTYRQVTKDMLKELEKTNRGVTARIFGAMRRAKVDGWAGKEFENYVCKTSVRS